MPARKLTRSPHRQPAHPGEILREDVLPALNLSVTAAAAHLGVSRQALHAVLSGRSAVSPEMAARIAKLVGGTPEIWLRLQIAHDLWRVERDLKDQLAQIPTLHAA